MILTYQNPKGQRRLPIRAEISWNVFGHPIILLPDGEQLYLSDWRRSRYKILQANRGEKRSLMRMGLL